MKKLLKEPLLHFVLIGAGLFLLFGWRNGPAPVPPGQSGPQSDRIVILQSAIDQMVDTFVRTWQRPPTEAEEKGLVESIIREEVYVREAVAAGLDRDDSVIRRRLRMKMEFILEDVAAQAEPTDEELRAYLQRHAGRYLTDPQFAFRQIYFKTEQGRAVDDDARQALARLQAGGDPDAFGDPFLLPSQIVLSPLSEIRLTFGEEFGRRLPELAQRQWLGPLRSGFGLHLIFIERRVGASVPELATVRDALKQDLMTERQNRIKESAYAKLRERYAIAIENPAGITSAPVAQAFTDRVAR